MEFYYIVHNFIIILSDYNLFFQHLVQMLNKNVADYTNFEGKTNKRIMQAPGGLSSISLAWQTQRKDHAQNNKNRGYIYEKSQPDPAYIIPNKNIQQNHNNYEYHSKQIYSPYNYGTPSNHNPSNPGANTRNMNNLYSYGQMGGELGYKNYNYGNDGYNNGHSHNNGYGSGESNVYAQIQNKNRGGYYSNNNYSNNNNNSNYMKQQINSINFSLPRSAYKPIVQQPLGKYNYNQAPSYNSKKGGDYSTYNPKIQQLDMAMDQYSKNKAYTQNNQSFQSNHNHNNQQYQFRPSVKVLGPPPQQFNIGNPQYNYWKDDQKDNIGKSKTRQRQIQSQKRMPSNQYQRQQKTSVKVSNPPGGRQNFTFG